MIGGGRASVRSIQVAIATWDAENQIEAQDRGGAKDYYHTWKGLLGLLSSWGRSESLPKRRPARVPDMRRCTVRWLLLHQQPTDSDREYLWTAPYRSASGADAAAYNPCLMACRLSISVARSSVVMDH